MISSWIVATAVSLVAAGAEARPPSVVVVIPDQLRAQSLGCMGNADVRSPNIDRLAAGGVLFRNTFANTPVCCPARAVMLTGKFAHKNGMVANDLRLRTSETTLAEILAARGYRTGFIGKWHLDGGPRLPGFIPPGPRRQGFAFWAANECSHAHFRPSYFRDVPEPIVDDRFEPEVWTDRAVEFVKAAGDSPFFLIVSMGPPHDPYAAPPEYMRQYDAAKLAMRPNWVEGTPGGSRKDIAAYYSAITAVDDQVGRLMKALDDVGRTDDTIVVLTSDHGDMLGSQGARLKRKPWEESIRVPGIIRFPAKARPGRSTDAIFSHVDLAPTLLGLCGLPVPADMQGADLSAIVTGGADRGPDSAFFQIFGPFEGDGTSAAWRGVRTDRHMYAETPRGPWVFYDLERDPFDKNNLIDDPAHAADLRRMRARLDEWMARTGDAWSLNWLAHVEDAGRLYKSGTYETVEAYLEWEAAHPAQAPAPRP